MIKHPPYASDLRSSDLFYLRFNACERGGCRQKQMPDLRTSKILFFRQFKKVGQTRIKRVELKGDYVEEKLKYFTFF